MSILNYIKSMSLPEKLINRGSHHCHSLGSDSVSRASMLPLTLLAARIALQVFVNVFFYLIHLKIVRAIPEIEEGLEV
jgi:hypothetical protein